MKLQASYFQLTTVDYSAEVKTVIEVPWVGLNAASGWLLKVLNQLIL